MADIWKPCNYGWSHVYWATIEGMPYVFSQATTGKTVPTGYTSELPTLVVADSARIGAVIDRDKGIGAGFPLSFTVLDSTELAGLMARPTAQTHLSADLAANTTPAIVEDTTDFAASGTIYIGKETITYSSKTATTFVLSGRGVNGLGYPHSARSTAAIITDKPRYWRGRFVTLYATPVDPTGFVTGTALDDDALVIWRGYLDSEPSRSGDGDGFKFSALPIDRILARKLSSRLTGVVQDTDARFEVTTTQCLINIELLDVLGATIGGGPWAIKFDAMASAASGDLVSITEFNASAVAAFTAAITTYGIGAYINGLDIIQSTYTPSNITYGAYKKGDWIPTIRFASVPTASVIKHSGTWCGNLAEVPNALAPNNSVAAPAGGLANNQPMKINVAYSGSPYALTNAYLGSGGGSQPSVPSIAIKLDQGDPGTLPDKGQADVGGNLYYYAGVGQTANAGTVVFKGFAPVAAIANPANIIGSEVSILISDPGNLGETTLRMIHSSGQANLRDTTYDTLLGRVGYGLPETYTDNDEILKVLNGGFLADIALSVSPDAMGYSDTLGGLLALSQRAVVVTDDGSSDALLSAVHTSSGVGGYAASLTDDYVLSVPSAVVTTQNVNNPNSITVTAELAGTDVDPSTTTDVSRVAFEGLNQLDFKVPSAGSEALTLGSAIWSLARVGGDQHAAILSIDVVPWLGVRIGDAVDLTLTHPNIWSFANSAIGYTGRARCIGRQIKLSTGATRLSLLIYGQSIGTALSPAAPVSAFGGLATNPTSIDVPTGFWLEFNRALTNNGADLRLLHYQPGEGAETATEAYTISAATITAGVCRLTVASVIGAPTLSATTSYLTWGTTATAGNYEKTYAHSGDSTNWT